MISQAVIEEVKNRLVRVYQPLAIYLFGSYAWGKPSEDSDLDLLVVIQDSDEKKFRRPIRGYDALIGLKIAKDIIVYTKQEFEIRSQDITTLCYKIKREAKQLYGKL